MAQFGRPSADTYNSDGYTTHAGGGANLYQTIDEVVADDADYIRTAVGPTNDVYVTKLTTIEDPLSSAGHTVRYRYGKDAAGGAQIDLTVQLRQGYTNEGSPGTLIAAWSHVDIPDGFTAAAQALIGAEADAITDYTDLYLRFVFNQV